MPTVQLADPSVPEDAVRSALDRWFLARGFKKALFTRRTLRVSTDRMGELIVYKLTQRSHHETYYKDAHGGALLVFEVNVGHRQVYYEGYCPLLLFGIWNRKLRFKRDVGGMFKYRAEGHQMEEAFRDHLRRSWTLANNEPTSAR